MAEQGRRGAAGIESFIIRRSDFSLNDEQQSLQESFRTFFEKRCPSERVRSAEPLGWDPDLWVELAELRPVAMGVPTDVGGDGGGLLELALVAEEVGRAVAPVPFVETVVTARLLADSDADEATAALRGVLDGEIATLALTPPRQGRHLVSAGAIATTVVSIRDDGVVLTRPSGHPPALANLASAPIAWCDLAHGRVIGSTDQSRARFAQAEREWRLLMAAALVGIGDRVTSLGVEYAKERTAFGSPIGAFQAIAHPLADAAIGVEGARRLVRKACWFADNEPSGLCGLVSMAFLHASEAAEHSCAVAMHTQGGFGFTVESDVQLYLRRAKGWPLVGGDRRRELQRIADAAYGPVNSARRRS
jgi:alkylation response protein AidB-like acyl-CoA dehydrogenase